MPVQGLESQLLERRLTLSNLASDVGVAASMASILCFQSTRGKRNFFLTKRRRDPHRELVQKLNRNLIFIVI